MRFAFRVLARRHVRQFIILLVLDAAVFGASDAQKVPSLMLAVGFVLFLATIYHVFYGIMSIARFYGFRLKRQDRFALYFTGVAGVLAALQSIGELSGRDIAVMVPLAAIGYLYSSYGSKLYNVNHGSE